jgi:hypothetical protein
MANNETAVSLHLKNASSGLISWLDDKTLSRVLSFLSLTDIFVNVALVNARVLSVVNLPSPHRSCIDLSVLSATLVSDAVVERLIKQFGSALTSLNLDVCENVSSQGVVAAATAAPDLQILRLAFCSRVDDVAIRSVAEHCSKLTQLDLFDCHCVTDASLCNVARNCQ